MFQDFPPQTFGVPKKIGPLVLCNQIVGSVTIATRHGHACFALSRPE